MKKLRYPGLRWFALHFVGDVIAYQMMGNDKDLGKPIVIPAPQFHKRIREKIGDKQAEDLGLGWANLIDPDDVIAYPLNPLGGEYQKVKDEIVNTGSILTDPNPLSHITYADRAAESTMITLFRRNERSTDRLAPLIGAFSGSRGLADNEKEPNSDLRAGSWWSRSVKVRL